MPLTNNGAIILAAGSIGDGAVVNLANGNCHLGVGDSTTAFSAAQNDLQASTNKLRKAATVTRVNAVLTFIATFGTSDANWAWEETAVFNALSAGLMAARKVQNLGTKTNASSWQLTYTGTVTAA